MVDPRRLSSAVVNPNRSYPLEAASSKFPSRIMNDYPETL
jgi:hypothetical protein